MGSWPNGKTTAVVFNVCLEAWSDGKAPGISPMGNPLPGRRARHDGATPGRPMGVKRGIYRLLDAFLAHGAVASVMVNAGRLACPGGGARRGGRLAA